MDSNTCTSKHPKVPTEDLASWVFNGTHYDREKPILIDPSDSSRYISYNQARDLVGRIATGIKKAGLRSGDCVIVNSGNDIYYPILFLGVIAAGGIFAGTNPGFKHSELAHHIIVSKAKFLISDPEPLSESLAAADVTGIAKEKIWIFDTTEGHSSSLKDIKSWKMLLQTPESIEGWVTFNDLETSKRTPAAIQFSSGTTGLPKAAILSHYNIVAQHSLAYDTYPRSYPIVRIIPLPLFHIGCGPVTNTRNLRMIKTSQELSSIKGKLSSLINNITHNNHGSDFNSALRAGVPTYIMRRFDVIKYVQYIQRYQVTDLMVVPPIVVALINCALLDDPQYMKSVRWGFSGAAPLNVSTQARLRRKLPEGVAFTQIFGMTETSCLALITPYGEDDDTGSVGRPIPGLEAKLIDDNGSRITTCCVRGELCLRGPTIFKGYFENEQANKECFDDDGWFKTGDVAYFSQDSKWYIVDRKKELIKVRGFQVAPPELEAILLSHSKVADAAVIGVRYPGIEDEHPRAYVVAKDKANPPDGDELKAFLAERLVKYKWLTGGVTIVNAIPKNPSGKILKKLLRQQSLAEVMNKSKI